MGGTPPQRHSAAPVDRGRARAVKGSGEAYGSPWWRISVRLPDLSGGLRDDLACAGLSARPAGVDGRHGRYSASEYLPDPLIRLGAVGVVAPGRARGRGRWAPPDAGGPGPRGR